MSRSRPRPLLPVLLALLLACVLAGAPSARADDGPTGPGVVEGTVRDERGREMPGASVQLSTSGRAPGTSGPWTLRHHETTTDARGRFRFEGIATPSADVSVGWVVAHATGYVRGVDRTVEARLRSTPRGPVDVDLVLRRRDATLRGRVAVRGGSPEGAWVRAARVDADGRAAEDEDLSTSTGDDGRWSLDVPAGRYRIQVESTYGLPTWWPDVAAARPSTVTPAVATGGTLDGLDVSMRLRLPGPAVDEFGVWQHGWDPARADDAPGRYDRDPYRSVHAVRGPELRVGTPRSAYGLPLPGLPDGDLIAVTGNASAIGLVAEVPLTNTGDDLLWIDPPQLEGPIAAASRCVWFMVAGCDVPQPIEPGATRWLRVEPNTTTWAPEYALDVVVPNTGGLGLPARVPLRLRNVGTEAFGRDDHRNLRGLWPYLSPEDREQTAGFLGMGPPVPPEVLAWAAAMDAAAKAPSATSPAARVPRRPAVGVVTVGRTSVRFTFPAAGRVEVRIDRLIRSTDRRRPDRWTRARSVVLRATRAGARTVRIRRLALGPYRVRVTARIGGKVRRVTDYRDVKP